MIQSQAASHKVNREDEIQREARRLAWLLWLFFQGIALILIFSALNSSNITLLLTGAWLELVVSLLGLAASLAGRRSLQNETKPR